MPFIHKCNILRMVRVNSYVDNLTLTGLLVSRCLYWAQLGVLPSLSPTTCTLKRISWVSALSFRGLTQRKQWLVSGWKSWENTMGNPKKKKKIVYTYLWLLHECSYFNIKEMWNSEYMRNKILMFKYVCLHLEKTGYADP